MFERKVVFGFLVEHLAGVATQLKMHRAGRAAGRFTKRLTQQIREARGAIDGVVGFGDTIPRAVVFRVLIRVTVARLIVLTAGNRNHRRACHMRVTHARRKIGGTDVLTQADARLVRGARVAVRHVSGGFFAVGHHALHAADFVDLQHGRRNNCIYIKQMRHAIAAHGFGEISVSGHFWHG